MLNPFDLARPWAFLGVSGAALFWLLWFLACAPSSRVLFLDEKNQKSWLCSFLNADETAKNLNCSNSPWCEVVTLGIGNYIALCFQADRPVSAQTVSRF